MKNEETMRNGTVGGDAIAVGLRQPRIWLDLGKLVAAAVVQGVVVSAVVALVVMLLASGAVAEQDPSVGTADGDRPAVAAARQSGAADADRTP